MKRLILALCFAWTGLYAQNYNSSEVFNPLNNYVPGNKYRSASGQPGPEYWQNRADYQIKASLDTPYLPTEIGVTLFPRESFLNLFWSNCSQIKVNSSGEWFG